MGLTDSPVARSRTVTAEAISIFLDPLLLMGHLLCDFWFCTANDKLLYRSQHLEEICR
jgi:hypothetical protein